MRAPFLGLAQQKRRLFGLSVADAVKNLIGKADSAALGKRQGLKWAKSAGVGFVPAHVGENLRALIELANATGPSTGDRRDMRSPGSQARLHECGI